MFNTSKSNYKWLLTSKKHRTNKIPRWPSTRRSHWTRTNSTSSEEGVQQNQARPVWFQFWQLENGWFMWHSLKLRKEITDLDQAGTGSSNFKLPVPVHAFDGQLVIQFRYSLVHWAVTPAGPGSIQGPWPGLPF